MKIHAFLVILWRQKGDLNKSDLKTFLYISLRHVWKIASSFSDPWFIFCWQNPETLNHHVVAKMLDLVHNLTLYWLGLMTLFAYLSRYVSLKLSAALPTRTIYEAIFHKNNMKNLHGHIQEDSSEITSILLKDFETLVIGLVSHLGEAHKRQIKILENKMGCLAWLSNLALQTPHSLSDKQKELMFSLDHLLWTHISF